METLVSITMSTTLKLNFEKHSQPYKLLWFRKGTGQALVRLLPKMTKDARSKFSLKSMSFSCAIHPTDDYHKVLASWKTAAKSL